MRNKLCEGPIEKIETAIWYYFMVVHINGMSIKRALGSITTNKASGDDGILAKLFQILKDDTVKVLHSICQQIWKTQQWP